MTSATAFKRFGICALLFAGLVDLSTGSYAQSNGQSGAAATESNLETRSTIDRGKMRLKLLINLVENELHEAKLRQSRLTTEASTLDQERRLLRDSPSNGTQAEKRQIDVIEQRLQRIDKEVAEVNGRLPEISTELAGLRARLDEANGVVRRPSADSATNGAVVDSASRWLDSKRQVQEALVYLGGYNALIDGDFGPRTAAAIKVYQGRQDLETTGTLNDQQEEALLEEAAILRARYGMTTIEDAENGYRITYPSGLLTEANATGPDARRYLSKDGKGELLVTSTTTGAASNAGGFSTLYEDLLEEYEVQYRRKRGDWFVVAGLIEEGRIIYDTARLNGGRLIRAQLSYPSAWRDLWSPFAVIMFNTFESLPTNQS